MNTKCYQIRNLRTVLGVRQTVMCYFAFVHSLLTYGIIVWGGSAASHDVFLAQKRVVRRCAGVDSTHSCRNLFRSFKILPLPCVYIRELLTYVFERVGSLRTRENIHYYNTRARADLLVPFRRLKITADAPSCLGLRLYNLLPDRYKTADKMSIFRSWLKTLLLEMCCYSVEEYVQALS